MYIATGDNYSTPATALSDVIVALEIGTGRVVWSQQTTPGDVYNSSCGTDKQNCPDEDGRDYDFGSSVILTRLPDGRDVLLAGQKSGMVYAFDREKKGKIIWQARIASRAATVGPSVGVQWGMASGADDGKVIWDFDTAREFQTVNDIKAKGGSIDGPGPVVANGMVFLNSGYSRFGGMPGQRPACLCPVVDLTMSPKAQAPNAEPYGFAGAGCGSATFSTSSSVSAGTNVRSRRTSSGSSVRSGVFIAGRTNVLTP